MDKEKVNLDINVNMSGSDYLRLLAYREKIRQRMKIIISCGIAVGFAFHGVGFPLIKVDR